MIQPKFHKKNFRTEILVNGGSGRMAIRISSESEEVSEGLDISMPSIS